MKKLLLICLIPIFAGCDLKDAIIMNLYRKLPVIELPKDFEKVAIYDGHLVRLSGTIKSIDITRREIELFPEFSCSMCVPFNESNAPYVGISPGTKILVRGKVSLTPSPHLEKCIIAPVDYETLEPAG